MGTRRESYSFNKNKKLWSKQITINGKRKVFSAKTKKEVALKIQQYLMDHGSSQPFEKVAEEWQEKNWDKLRFGSYRTYSPCLDRAIAKFGKKSIDKITSRDVQTWLNELGQQYAKKTVSNHKCILSQIFRFAIIDMNLDLINPCDNVKLPSGLRKTTRDAITPAEIEAIKSTTKDEFQLGFLILYTGCRLGEALALQMSDVDLKNGLIYITKSVGFRSNQPAIQQPKTEKSIRTVPLFPQLRDRLMELKLKQTDYIVSGGAKPITKSVLQRRWDNFCSSKGIDIDRHSIRHTYASICNEAGLDMKSIQTLLGHAQLSTTMDIYTHITEKKQMKDNIKLSTYFVENIG